MPDRGRFPLRAKLHAGRLSKLLITWAKPSEASLWQETADCSSQCEDCLKWLVFISTHGDTVAHFPTLVIGHVLNNVLVLYLGWVHNPVKLLIGVEPN